MGQIYIPFVNWTLMLGVALLVLGFQSSGNLASAYGIAVTGTFAIDTILVFVVMRVRWDLGLAPTLAGMATFLIIDLSFFGANAVKIPDGGWFPLAVAGTVFTLLVTWRSGRDIVTRRLRETSIPMEDFLVGIALDPPPRVPGTAVFMTGTAVGVPAALLHNLKHNKVLHERTVLLTVRPSEMPYYPLEDRLEVSHLGQGFHRVVVRYGFMDDVDIPLALAECPCGMKFDPMETSFFFSRENLIPKRGEGMALWREHLFAVMARGAASPMSFFRIPPNRVIEMGTQLEI